jgi:hypothetical protein
VCCVRECVREKRGEGPFVSLSSLLLTKHHPGPTCCCCCCGGGGGGWDAAVGDEAGPRSRAFDSLEGGVGADRPRSVARGEETGEAASERK